MDASSILQESSFNSQVSIYTFTIDTHKSTPNILPHYLKEQARSAVIWAWRFFFFFFFFFFFLFFFFFSYCLRCSINALHDSASNEHPTYTPPLLTPPLLCCSSLTQMNHNTMAGWSNSGWIQSTPIPEPSGQKPTGTDPTHCASFRGKLNTPEY